MSWNRELDQVEAKTLFELKENGFKKVDKKHIIHFRSIYDFICMFADPEFAGDEHTGIRLVMSTGEPIPPKTREIIYSIGIENLFMYFSINAYQKEFYNFCERLIRTKKISSKDYLADGYIVPIPYKIEVKEYEE